MASIVAFMVGAGMTGGFAYGIHKLRKDKKTDTTTYKVFIAGLVIGIVILIMAMFMVARGSPQATVQGATATNQPPLALPNQLRYMEKATRAEIVDAQTRLESLGKAINAATAAVEAQKLLKQK
jgi:cytochrome bd-type quinol oxidase subunit 1